MLAVFALDTCVDLLAVPALVSAGLAPARPTLHVSFDLIYRHCVTAAKANAQTVYLSLIHI